MTEQTHEERQAREMQCVALAKELPVCEICVLAVASKRIRCRLLPRLPDLILFLGSEAVLVAHCKRAAELERGRRLSRPRLPWQRCHHRVNLAVEH